LTVIVPEKQPIQQAVDHFLASPEFSELSKFKISQDKWTEMMDIEMVLCVSHKYST
jgi:hypothetical protein